MAILLGSIYSIIFTFFGLPVILIMILGKPRFLIKLINIIYHLKDPVKKIKIMRALMIVSFLVMLWNGFNKYMITRHLSSIDVEESQFKYIETKAREAQLCERNFFMFLAFFIMFIIIEKFCETYKKLWNLEDYRKENIGYVQQSENNNQAPAKAQEDKKKE